LLQSVCVDGSTDLPLSEGTDVAFFTPQFDDIQSNYHLIAVADSSSDVVPSTVEFGGGVFYAENTASTPQNFLYVFGTPGGDGDTVNIYGNGDTPANSVVFDGTTFGFSSISPAIAAIHVRGEAGDDTFLANEDVSLPLWLFGGDGDNTLVGGVGGNLIVGGSGQNSIFNDGASTPQIVGTQTEFSGLPSYYQEIAGTWTNDPTPGTAYGGGQRLHAAGGTGEAASWTFANLDSSPYYEVYATWSPEADASTAAQYTVSDGGTTIEPIGESSTPTANQTLAPTDFQAAGVYWQDLGVFQPSSDTLVVSLAADASSPVLANAVMIVPESTPPLTSLSMGAFTVDNQGNLSVSYTINGEDAPPFSIGIYGSPDGVQPANQLQSYEVDDPTLLTGGGATHTVTFPASLNNIDSSQYVIAQLDSGDDVQETSRADNISTALSGIFEQSDGTLMILGNSTSLTGNNISLTQDVNGNVTASVADSSGDPISSQTFSAVSSVILSTPAGGNSMNVDPSMKVPVSAYAGSGSSVAGTTTASTSVTVSPVPAEVMLGATTPVASENAGSSGEFGITCGGGSAGNVTVAFTLSNATYGTDYTCNCSGADVTLSGSGGTITMPGNVTATYTIYVKPIDVGQVGGSQTVTMTLTSGTGYSIMSGWSNASVTIEDDDSPGTPDPSFVAPKITAFNAAGGQVSSASAPVGDFIPIEIWIAPGSPNWTTFILICPSTIALSSTPDGPNFNTGLPSVPGGPAFATFGPSYGYFVEFYASAASTSGGEVSGAITAEWASGGCDFTPVSISVDFKPLQMYNWGTPLGTATSSAIQTVKIGQLMSLQVKDPSGIGGLVSWSTPGGSTVKSYQQLGPNGQAAKSCAPVYLSSADLRSYATGPSLSQAPLSFAWVSGGTGAPNSPVPSYIETATLSNPFGVAQAQAMFKVLQPPFTETALANEKNNAAGKGGISLSADLLKGEIRFANIGGYSDRSGMTFASNPNGSFGEFFGSWCQVINSAYSIELPDDDAIPSVVHRESNALDAYFRPPNQFEAVDSPGVFGLNNDLRTLGPFSGEFAASFSTWYMVKPAGVAHAIWVPIAKFDWNVSVGFIWGPVLKEVAGPAHTQTPGGPKLFTPTTQFPSWTSVL
jgi:hypothetical protein